MSFSKMGNIENEKDKLDLGIVFGMPTRHLIGQWAIGFKDQVLRGHIWAGNTDQPVVLQVSSLTCLRLAKADHLLWCTFHECQTVTPHLLDNDCHPLQC